MFSTRALNCLGGLVLLALLAFAGAHAHAQASTPSAWREAERRTAFDALRQAGERPDDAEAMSDERLTATVLRRARTELGQRVRPAAVDPFWAIEAPRRDVAAELAAARLDGRLAAWLAELSPPAPAYRSLQALAIRYQGFVAGGGWTPLPKGPAFGPGEHGAAVTALRTRLAREGYGPPDATDPAAFDPSLSAALAVFQRTHDLPESGRVDAATRAALDVTADARRLQIEANLERWRWMPRELPADRLELDVASQTAVLFNSGAPVLDMRVIVGDPHHRTPMFISRLTSVVFDPPWNVPKDITEHELLPKAAKDPGYLVRENFIWIDGRLQQRPGPKNSLGLIKFDLSSPFGVYLHDTPARSLFARRARALSHGCMRLEKPQALAEALLASQGWTPETISAAMAAGQTKVAPLKRPLPLYVVYRTVTVADGGEPRFRADIYGWDRKLTEALLREARDAKVN